MFTVPIYNEIRRYREDLEMELEGLLEKI